MSDDPRALLADLTASDATRHGRAFDRVYDELRRMARRYLVPERDDHSLQPTELVNEACLRLLPSVELDELTRGRLLGFGARAMRRVLTDHARKRAAAKRGGEWARVTLRGVGAEDADAGVPLVALDAALSRLEEDDPRLAEMTELHYFAGVTGAELAVRYGVSRSTVTRELALARALLLREIDRLDPEG